MFSQMKKIKNNWRERFEKSGEEKLLETKDECYERGASYRKTESLEWRYEKSSPEPLQQLDGHFTHNNLPWPSFRDPLLPTCQISPQRDFCPRKGNSSPVNQTFIPHNKIIRDFHISQLTCHKEDARLIHVDLRQPVDPVEKLKQLKDIEFSQITTRKSLPPEHTALPSLPVNINTTSVTPLSEPYKHDIIHNQKTEKIYSPQQKSSIKPPTKSQKSLTSKTPVKKNGAPRKR